MAISCANCGRQYDVTLFQFGRTINCACGERVGLEHKLNLPRKEELKLFADVNVARLVRLARAIGIDTRWENAISDDDLIRRSIEEKRFVLTLDKRILLEYRVDNVLLLHSQKPFEQFREIIEHFDIKKPEKFFTRCLVCNTILRTPNAEEISVNRPETFSESVKNFSFCPYCRKLYWEGSHTRRMRAAIEEIFRQIDL